MSDQIATKVIITSVVTLVAAVGLYHYFQSTNKIEKKKQQLSKKESVPLNLPIIDVKKLLNKNDSNENEFQLECKKVAECLHKYGIIVLRDPRVTEVDNDNFIDLMEKYFECSDGIRDARPEHGYQVGVTPDGTEHPRNHCSKIGSMTPDNKPISLCPPEKDPKWRFFWRIGPRPEKTEFASHNMDCVIPPEFPEWRETMDKWGSKMLDALVSIAEMAAVGFDMPKDAFTNRMKFGPHLLAPTGSDFNRFGTEGTVLAGFHYDLNFLTIHGKSRFPGLFLWTRDGTKTSVRIPDGCLLVQAGKQIEYLTGGYVLAGFHEVVVTNETSKVIIARKEANKSLWRVSSTLFGHIQSDQVLEPLPPFSNSSTITEFPPLKAGHQVLNELQAINLSK
eukprot:gene5987-8244_t